MIRCLIVGAMLTALAAPPEQEGTKELKITDDKVGTGAEAKKGDILVVHYTGWLKDGTKFDSSKDRKVPFEFKLGEGKVIKGWEQGMLGMKTGGVRKLVIPSDLAYGAKGRPSIPPNSELTFEVELLSIKEEPKLKIIDEKVGTGAEAKKGDTLVVHYTGWLKDGKKFDSSKDSMMPFEFKLGAGNVIQGWDQGMVGMKPGGIRKLIIPPELGYGARGAGGVIPANAELTFEVELLSIK